jgi:hypothetical protein
MKDYTLMTNAYKHTSCWWNNGTHIGDVTTGFLIAVHRRVVGRSWVSRGSRYRRYRDEPRRPVGGSRGPRP